MVPPEPGGCGRPRGRPPAACRRGRRDSTIRPRPDLLTRVRARLEASARRTPPALACGGREVLGQQLGVRLDGGELLGGDRRGAAPPRARHHLGDLEAGGVLRDHGLRQQVEHAVRAAGRTAAQAGGAERPQVGLGGQPDHGEVRRGRRQAGRVHRRARSDRPRVPVGRAQHQRVGLGQAAGDGLLGERVPGLLAAIQAHAAGRLGGAHQHAGAEARQRLHDVGRRRSVAGHHDPWSRRPRRRGRAGRRATASGE